MSALNRSPYVPLCCVAVSANSVVALTGSSMACTHPPDPPPKREVNKNTISLPGMAPTCLFLPCSAQDYSYMETPELPIERNGTIISRIALPNPHILAYIGGEPAWGTPPAGFDAMAGQAAGNAPAGTVAALLAGVAWSELENAAHRDRVT